MELYFIRNFHCDMIRNSYHITTPRRIQKIKHSFDARISFDGFAEIWYLKMLVFETLTV